MGETRFNMRMAKALRICRALDETAEILTLSDSGNWAAWLCYLLQALEDKAPGAGSYEQVLKNLQKAIAARLERGRW